MNKEKMLDGDNEPIYLIYQYFLPKTEKRRKEVQEALTRNIANTHISKIHLLCERHYTDEELGVSIPTDKIVQEVIKNNPGPVQQYKDGKTTTIGFLVGGYVFHFRDEFRRVAPSGVRTIR